MREPEYSVPMFNPLYGTNLIFEQRATASDLEVLTLTTITSHLAVNHHITPATPYYDPKLAPYEADWL